MTSHSPYAGPTILPVVSYSSFKKKTARKTTVEMASFHLTTTSASHLVLSNGCKHHYSWSFLLKQLPTKQFGCRGRRLKSFWAGHFKQFNLLRSNVLYIIRLHCFLCSMTTYFNATSFLEKAKNTTRKIKLNWKRKELERWQIVGKWKYGLPDKCHLAAEMCDLGTAILCDWMYKDENTPWTL